MADRTVPAKVRPTATVSQASGWPLVGNALAFLSDPIAFFDRLRTRGDLIEADLPGIQSLAVYHPSYVQQILMHDEGRFTRWNWQEIFDLELIPQGLTSVEGERWRRQRRQLQPLFSLERLAQFDETMRTHVERQIEDWPDRNTIELGPEFRELSLSILAESLLDIDLRTHGQVINRATAVLNERVDFTLLGAVEMLLPDNIPTPSKRRYNRAMTAFDEMMSDLIAERRASPGAYDDLLTAMLEHDGSDEVEMSDAVIRDQVLAFLFAGQDTTASALTFTGQLLAAHPNVQASVQDEVDAVLGDEKPTPDTLSKLTVTENVIREALRLYPPTAILFRQAAQPTLLGDVKIPAGTKLLIPQVSIQTDARWYDHPNTFWPSRWEHRPMDERHEYAYLPFGGGPHHCIGMRFAMLEMKYALTLIAQELELELVSTRTPDVEVELSMHPSTPVVVRAHRRAK